MGAQINLCDYKGMFFVVWQEGGTLSGTLPAPGNARTGPTYLPHTVSTRIIHAALQCHAQRAQKNP